MKTSDFIQAIETAYSSKFPQSKAFVKLSHNLYSQIRIDLMSAGTKEENAMNYWENDCFSLGFTISLENGQLPKDLSLDSEMPINLLLESKCNSYRVKPENQYMFCGYKKVPFRKTKGNDAKLLKTIESFIDKLHASILSDIENNNILESDVTLLKTKVGTK
jgi:uncharacterized protein YunC (DUF1805 family)